MDKICAVICVFVVLVAPACCRRFRQSSSYRNLMAFRDGNSYVSCCFVDIFCYNACFNSPGDLRALVSDYDTWYRPSETRHQHHRHRHQHGTSISSSSSSSFRTKRTATDNVLWEKLRKSLSRKSIKDEYRTNG